MKKSILIPLFLFVAVGLFVYGCGTTPDGGGSTGTTATLGHMYGFDFSTGSTPEVGTDPDVDIIGWAPSPGMRRDSTTEVWSRCWANTTTENFTKDYGAVALSTITTVPSSWDGTLVTTLDALAISHSYVIKCADGYAKFIVTSINAASWEAGVIYEYTSGTTW